MQKAFIIEPVQTIWTSSAEANLAAAGSGSSSVRDARSYIYERVRLLVDLNNVDNDVYFEGDFGGEWYELYRLNLSAATSRNVSAIIEAPFGNRVRFTKSGTAGSVVSVKIQPMLSRVTAFGGGS